LTIIQDKEMKVSGINQAIKNEADTVLGRHQLYIPMNNSVIRDQGTNREMGTKILISR